jgi:hypothetical protein
VTAFRNALVVHVNTILSAGPGRWQISSWSPDVAQRVGEGSGRLSREYGRLNSRIVRAVGVASMGSPMLGTTSQDVVEDAIIRPDLCRAFGRQPSRARKPF